MTISTERMDDGSYKASCVSVPEIIPVVDPKETMAISLLKVRMQQWLADGCGQVEKR